CVGSQGHTAPEYCYSYALHLSRSPFQTHRRSDFKKRRKVSDRGIGGYAQHRNDSTQRVAVDVEGNESQQPAGENQDGRGINAKEKDTVNPLRPGGVPFLQQWKTVPRQRLIVTFSPALDLAYSGIPILGNFFVTLGPVLVHHFPS